MFDMCSLSHHFQAIRISKNLFIANQRMHDLLRNFVEINQNIRIIQESR